MDAMPALLQAVEKHWGYRTLRPLQDQAMRAVLDGRDSLIILPTGGGKSLCYQAPALLREDSTTVVVSPLIALMKDQVDGLRACGVPAVQIDSSQTFEQQKTNVRDLKEGKVRLLFVSPERLVLTDFYQLLQKVGVHTFAIDEAHCISHWGHDFRQEYRQLSRLRDFFPEASVHAYTATATEQVREDIRTQLSLRDPLILVGNFDRPNLTYRVLPRHDPIKQVMEVLERHKDEAGIIYCLRRKDVEELTEALQRRKVNALPYHAKLAHEVRQATSEAFRNETCNVVVATIAFGMGIDRSDVRFVIHAALPQSLEHYQQETGRAGRDSLPAECVLFYSGADALTRKAMLQKSASEPGVDPSYLPNSLRHLAEMDRFARGAVCRHKALVNYFGQEYVPCPPLVSAEEGEAGGLEVQGCGACDLCLGDMAEVPESSLVAQKILSCVARVRQGFGIGHVIDILRGKSNDNVRKRGHDKLSTFGILKEGCTDADLRDWVYQLIGQGVLEQQGDEYPLLKLNEGSWEVMRGEKQVRLIQMVRRKKSERTRRLRGADVVREGADDGLLAALKALRRQIAAERQIASFQVFGDLTLLDLARVRPSTPQTMRMLYGVGEMKLRDFGPRFLALIADYCRARNLSQDQGFTGITLFDPPTPTVPTMTARKESIFSLFRSGASLEDVMQKMDFKKTTAVEHLTDYIRAEKPASIERWVDGGLYARIADAARHVGATRLKPIFLALGEKVAYEDIRLVVAHLQTRAEEG